SDWRARYHLGNQVVKPSATRVQIFPPPGGEGGRATARPGGGSLRHRFKPPTPGPSPQGGGVQKVVPGEGMTRIKSLTRRRCRELRNNSAPPERLLWQYLRILNQSGMNFRRQAPIGKFIADFADYGHRLVIALDGDTHAGETAASYDAKRDGFLRRQGFSVL